MRPIYIASAIALILSQPLLASASSPSPGENNHQAGNQPARAGEPQELANRYSWQALGQEVYRDLQRARRATAQRNVIDTRMALRDASRILDSFYDPVMSQALQHQIAVVRKDLDQDGVKPRADLWLPLEAQLNQVLLVAPPQHRVMARSAVEEGRNAAVTSDRDTARERLDVLEELTNHHWGLLPLSKIRGDVHSAEMALDPAPPYWKGIDEAMQSALAAVQWVNTTAAKGWFSAYEEALHARLQLPDHPQLAQAALQRAGQDLDGLKDGAALGRKAHQLATQAHPDGKAVESLLQDLREGISG